MLVGARPLGPQTPPGYDVPSYNQMFVDLSRARGTPYVRLIDGLSPAAQGDPRYCLPNGHLADEGDTVVAKNVAARIAGLLKAQ